MTREEAIEILTETEYTDRDFYEAVGMAIEALQAEPKHGEWVGKYKNICSVCGKRDDEFIRGWGEWETYGDSKFCPNCGAKMNGGKE